MYEHTHFITLHQEPIQRDVTGGTEGNHQLANVVFDAAPHQRMRSEIFNRRLNHRRVHGVGRLLQLLERRRRIDYLRHGLGRASSEPFASR